MLTATVTPADLQRSVIAVPPLARRTDLTLATEKNRKLVEDLAIGGVHTLLYGGNANLYHVGVEDYPALLEMLEAIAGEQTWMIPSIGPDYGRLIAQARLLRDRRFPTAMVLPQSFPATATGIETGIRHAADTFGRPLIAYIKQEHYLPPEALAGLIDAGAVLAVKYAVVRDDPTQDDYLRALIEAIGTERLVSGIGERPAIDHWETFGLNAFTSGSVCIAPTLSSGLRQSLIDGDIDTAWRLRETFMPLEDQRDSLSPIRVMHDAVSLAGIADMGPMLPLMSGLDDAQKRDVRPAVTALRQAEIAAR